MSVLHANVPAKAKAYLLVGGIEANLFYPQYNAFLRLRPVLEAVGFKVVINPHTTTHDLEKILADPATSLIVWSSHGTPKGQLLDADHYAVPTKPFLRLARSPLPFWFLCSACYGNRIQPRYFPAGKNKHRVVYSQFWAGEIQNTFIASQLLSPQFQADLKEILSDTELCPRTLMKMGISKEWLIQKR